MDRPPKTIQHYFIHFKNGEVIPWDEDFDLQKGIVSMWEEHCGKAGQKLCALCDELGDRYYFPWDNVSFVQVGMVEKTGW